MKSFGKYALVITGSFLVGASLFIASFIVMDFGWAHFVVTDPKMFSLGDGVVVVGGGFVIGTTLGLAGLFFVLYRFWPGRVSK